MAAVAGLASGHRVFKQRVVQTAPLPLTRIRTQGLPHLQPGLGQGVQQQAVALCRSVGAEARSGVFQRVEAPPAGPPHAARPARRGPVLFGKAGHQKRDHHTSSNAAWGESALSRASQPRKELQGSLRGAFDAL